MFLEIRVPGVAGHHGRVERFPPFRGGVRGEQVFRTTRRGVAGEQGAETKVRPFCVFLELMFIILRSHFPRQFFLVLDLPRHRPWWHTRAHPRRVLCANYSPRGRSRRPRPCHAAPKRRVTTKTPAHERTRANLRLGK